jgi:hypothetical protein
MILRQFSIISLSIMADIVPLPASQQFKLISTDSTMSTSTVTGLCFVPAPSVACCIFLARASCRAIWFAIRGVRRWWEAEWRLREHLAWKDLIFVCIDSCGCALRTCAFVVAFDAVPTYLHVLLPSCTTTPGSVGIASPRYMSAIVVPCSL